MKKIYSLLMAVALLCFWSCDEKENMDPVGNWEMTNPVISAPADNAVIVLKEDVPDSTIRFEWQPATASNSFLVQYEVVLVKEGTTDFSDPILSLTPSNLAKNVFVTPTAEQIDYALSAACYPAGSEVKLQWVVIAKAIEKRTTATQKITFKRFEHETIPSSLFLTGDATEGGSDVTKAIATRALKNAEGDQTGVFELYTHLNEGSTFYFRDQKTTPARKFGGADGKISCGTTITAPETGEYRVTVDLVNNTYTLLKIDRWSLVGDAVEGGWGGDVPLTYAGNSTWQADIMFYQPYEGAGFIFRANGDWGYLLKRIKGTAAANNKGGKLIMESEGNEVGVKFEDIPGTTGLHKVTLALTADGYAYTLTKLTVPVETIIGKAKDTSADAVTGTFPIEGSIPSELYLLEGGEMILKFTKDGSIFKSNKFVALQASKSYSLNSAADGSGTTFDGDDDGVISVDHDQAYTISVDFDKKELSWKHYNLKLFHWDEVGGGWEQRKEYPMAYTHPFKFDVTAELTGGYHSKINSPWEVQFGTASTALSGTMNNVDGGPNFTGIVSSGTYKVTITVADDYKTGQYSFVKQ
jgi:hypothetical protein